MMLLIGLTGGIASGKSTVARHLIEKGVTVIDADLIARQIVEPGEPAWQEIKEAFGSSVLTTDGTLNREKLGAIIFNDQEKRSLLNSITHPKIHREIVRQMMVAFFQFKRYAVVDLPLLFETNRFTNYFHKIIVVYATEQNQIDRLRSRNNFTKEEAIARIGSQMPLINKRDLADYVVDNNGSMSNTLTQVDAILEEINSSKAYLKYRSLIFFLLFNATLFTYIFVYRASLFVRSFF